MTPELVSTAADATTAIYKIGGLVGVLLALLVLVVYFFGRFLLQQNRDLGKRLDQVQDKRVELLTTHIKDGTSGIHKLETAVIEMTCETKKQTERIENLTTAIQANPAFRHITPRPGG